MPGDESGSRPVEARAFVYGHDRPLGREISVPVETAVEIAYGGVPFAVMMLTPCDLEDFAHGFSLTEGLIGSARDIRDVSRTRLREGLRLDVNLLPGPLSRHFARRRAVTGRTGCGVCGIEDLASLHAKDARSVAPPPVELAAIARAVSTLEAGQALNRETRSVHGAAWADEDGRLLHIREDVGRHNALDKLIGCLMRADFDPARGFVVITSRCSFEMVDKAAAFGAGMLVAVSGPTSLALDRARRLGMALFGIARHDGVTAFVGSEALVDDKAPA